MFKGDQMGSYRHNMGFEAEVRRIAEAVWSLAPGECQPEHYPSDPVVRELDGIARLRDVTHLVMATTSTRLDKAKEDVKKLNAAEILERPKVPTVCKWLITEHQLDAQHIEHARKNNVTALTLEQFQRRFFDGRKYLSLRSRCAFGSARDPNTESINFADDAYVALPMTISAELHRSTGKGVGGSITLNQILERLGAGEIVILRAPFGSGKSLTTRELFRELLTSHQSKPEAAVPIALNLRDHWGEDHSDEMLERHARSVGYSPKEDLVIAWRAGMCCILLDGFDEVATQTVVRIDDKNFMRDARRRALQGVRDFTQKIPSDMGVFICGRDHYFDTDNELLSALGILNKPCTIIDLKEFSEAKAIEFLRKNGITHRLPDWLPRKPLLLSYLVRAKLFDQILEIDSSKGFGHAWDHFLQRICEREAALEGSSMDAGTIRAVMERLADLVRTKSSGTGPVTGNDLASAYTTETGQSAGEGVLAQLQRLPGLTQRDSEPGTRSFVDLDMLGALQGGAFARQVLSAFKSAPLTPIAELSEEAALMAMHLLSAQKVAPETMVGIIDQLQRRAQREQVPVQIIADCVALAIRMAAEQEANALDFRSVTIDGASFGKLPLDEITVQGLSLRNCIIREVAFGSDQGSRQVSITGSLIAKVSGVANYAGIPRNSIAPDCDIDEFDNMGTNNAVLRLSIDPRLKALITILRKLYKQRGAGRKLAAFKRGITSADVLQHIEPVLGVLGSHQFISVFNSVVHAVRRQAYRVEQILAAPTLSTDEIVIEVMKL
jgi:hypothetical protein